ncbi:hypothetical protein [Aeromicrobium sp. Leaf350]|uniref:hypothetical protein n=1 Tax=Aeromicrobium sp. Leaf350 TaxID=2876565 RepID=UPI001E36CB81|nr:hypothetical protein [Aeromicrobium sp. Leaf350]
MTVPVPDARHSLHAVVTARPLEPVEDVPVPLPSEALLRRFGADEAQIKAFEARPHARVLHRSGPVGSAATDAVAARREALTLAAQHDGLVLDLSVPRLVTHTVDETDPRAPRQWVALDVEGAGLEGTDVVSHGLTTFGLPELRCAAVPLQELPATLAVLTGLAHRLLVEWPQNDPLGRASVTLADIATAMGEPEPPRPDDGAGYGIDVRLKLRGGELAVTVLGDAAALFT